MFPAKAQNKLFWRSSCFIITFLVCIASYTVRADFKMPSPHFTPHEVVAIQLAALKVNDVPKPDYGIQQTWIFAHPDNKRITGPIQRFSTMIKDTNYQVLLNHIESSIEVVSNDYQQALFNIRIFLQNGDVYGCRWKVARVNDGVYTGSWMTIGVSPPIPIGSGV
ncbi:MAG: hypothetical protein CBB68_09110 [Rhodospirillaceae bacterium TMED8]|nr:hypothetical protein [Magnetovibrio sp.]OUT50517.1 MAG: hypothetical protein CBB68_09110 [Rhodospirillaceae bacterium TMED8]|tara:strand:+ start:1882 stop:2376 length:495 start_codon:yes stop_codon:yes gene_type:complete